MKRFIVFFILLMASVSYGLEPGLIGVEEGDGSPSAHVWKLIVDNNTLSVSDSIATIDISGAAGGSPITLDIEDDGGDDSTDVDEIATKNDTNDIFTEPSPDKLYIDLSKNWPAADSADAVAADAVTDLGIDWGTGANQVSPADFANEDIGDITITGGSWAIDTVSGANSVDSDVYVDGSIDAAHLAADVIDEGKIADNGIDSEHYNDGSIDAVHLAADIIDETKIADNGIDSEHYNDGSIDKVHLAADVIDETKLEDESIDSEHYNDGSIDPAHLNQTFAVADGFLLDFNSITMTDTVAEGLTVPDCPVSGDPNVDKNFICYDASGDRFLAWEQGEGWVDTSSGSGAGADDSFITYETDGDLSNDLVLTGGAGVDITLSAPTATLSFNATEIDAVTWSDQVNASNIWTFAVSGTDHTMTAGNGLMTFGDAVTVTDLLTASNGVTIGTGTALTLGVVQWDNGSDAIDGDVIANDTIDDDSIDFGDVTGVDLTLTDATAVTATGTVQGEQLTSTDDADINDALTVGNIIIDEAAGTLDFTGVTSATITSSGFGTISFGNEHLITTGNATAAAITATTSMSLGDGDNLNFGTGNYWVGEWNNTNLALEFTTALVAATATDDPMFFIQVDSGAATMTADQDVFGVYKGTTRLFDIDEDGDVYILGKLTIVGTTDDHFMDLTSNAGTPSSAGTNSMYVISSRFKIAEGGTEKDIITPDDTVTWTGSTHSFVGVTSMVLPDTADAAGEISLVDSTDILWLGLQDGAGAWMSFDFTGIDGHNTYVMAWDEASNKFTAQAQAGGSPKWDTVADPTADVNIIHPINVETQFTYTGNFTTGSQFNIEQLTGNPTGGVLFEVTAADANVTVARLGDGTNYTQIGQTGNLTQTGTAAATFANVTTFNENVDINLDAADEEVTISQSNAAGTEDDPLIFIDDDREGATATELGEATIEIDAEGVYAINILDGSLAVEGDIVPTATSGASLGTDALDFSDLFLADGGVINMDSGDATITHATANLTIAHTTGDVVLSAADTDQDITFTVDDGDTDWDVMLDGSAGQVVIGKDAVAFDYSIKFDAATADGTITWDQDPGEWDFAADIKTTEDIVVGDGKYIGSATDPLAIQIENDGDVVFTDDIYLSGNDLVFAAAGTIKNAAAGGLTIDMTDPSAGAGQDYVTVSGTLPIADGSDTYRGVYLNFDTSANHTGTSNATVLVDIAAPTGDPNANLYGIRLGNLTGSTGAAGEVEYGLQIGTGWDSDIHFADTTAVITTGGTLTLEGLTVDAGAVSGASTLAMTSTLTGATGITLGSATTDAASDFTMIMGARDDDPQFVIAMSDDTNGDVTMTTTNGDDADISIVSTDDIMLDPGGDVINFVSTTETMSLTNGSNLWTFDSAGDTFVFNDATDVAATLSANALTLDNGATITFTDGASDTITHTDDTGIAMVSTSGTVTIESVVFTGGAMTSVASIGMSGAITLGNGEIITNATVDDEIELTTDDKEGIIFDLDTGTANEVAILSGTGKGVTEINTALNFVTTGIIHGAIKISAKSGGYTVGSDDPHESYGTMFVNTGANKYQLPTPAAGMNFCIMSAQGDTNIITIAIADADYIVIDGVRGTIENNDDAAEIASLGAAGDQICLIAYDATDWYVISDKGTWAETP